MIELNFHNTKPCPSNYISKVTDEEDILLSTFEILQTFISYRDDAGKVAFCNFVSDLRVALILISVLVAFVEFHFN